MRFEFERRTVFLSSFWKDGTYYGRNRTARPEPYSLWAAPDRSGDLVAYDPQTGFTARFRFDPKAGTLTSRSPSPITFTKTPG